jgi:hypothetical protein
MGILPALLPLVVGALAAAVAYGRRDGHIAAKGAAPSSLSAAAAPAPAARRARTRRAA